MPLGPPPTKRVSCVVSLSAVICVRYHTSVLSVALFAVLILRTWGCIRSPGERGNLHTPASLRPSSSLIASVPCLIPAQRDCLQPSASTLLIMHDESSPQIPSTPSLVLSVLTVCVFTVKLGVSVLQLCRAIRSVRSIPEARLCSILFIVSILLCIFSILSNENALRFLLP